MKFVTGDNLTEFKRKCDEVYAKKAETSDPNAVLFVPQSLSDTQKQQARTNIGAQVVGNYITDKQFAIKADKDYVDTELAKKQDKGDYVTTSTLTTELAKKQDAGNYVTEESLTPQLNVKQDKIDNSLTTTDKTVAGAINELKTSVAGLQNDILQEAHFRGYFATNAELQASPGNINDYAYSAESGTVWTHNGTAWEDTDEPVPDKVTPLSDTTPLQDGTAAAGSANAAARGDHVHPTDTSRASNTEFQAHVVNQNNPHSVTAVQIGAYTKPQTGIPKTDLDATLQASLTNVESIPVISTADNDKLLGVVLGQWGLIGPMTNEEVDALFE